MEGLSCRTYRKRCIRQALQHSHREAVCAMGSVVYLVHDKRHPRGMWPTEVEAFLTHLAVAQGACLSFSG